MGTIEYKVTPLAAYDVTVYDGDTVVFSTHFSGSVEDAERLGQGIVADLTTQPEV